MSKNETRNVARASSDRDVRTAERPRCVELSAFELELIAGGGAPTSERNAGGLTTLMKR